METSTPQHDKTDQPLDTPVDTQNLIHPETSTSDETSLTIQPLTPSDMLKPDLQTFSKTQRTLFTEGKWVDHEFLMLNEHVRRIDDKTVDISNGGIIKTILRPNFPSSYPLPFSRVRCHVIGKVKATGHVFMNTYESNEPLVFMLGQQETVRALEISVQTMKTGEIARLECKYDFCYGDFGNASMGVPERAEIIYEVHLLEYLPGPKKIQDGLLKRYEKRGYGWDTPLNGTVCHIRISGRLHDEVDGELFLEATDEPILALIDDPHLPEGLEEALLTMKRGEISVYEISSPHLLGDGFERRRHIAQFPTDINPDDEIKVYYRIELCDMDPIKETWVMTPQERIQEASRLKDIGNTFFRYNQYKRAFKRYNLIIEMFEHENMKQLSDEDKQSIHTLRTSSLNNMQVAKMKEKEYRQVIDLATQTITIDTFHIRSYYRKAQSYLYVNDSEQALDTLELAFGLYQHLDDTILTPQIRKDMDKLLSITKARRQKDLNQEKRAWSQAFNKLAHTDERKNSLEKPVIIDLSPEESKALSTKLTAGPDPNNDGEDDEESLIVAQANEVISKRMVTPVSDAPLPPELSSHESAILQEVQAESLHDAKQRISDETRAALNEKHNEVD